MNIFHIYEKGNNMARKVLIGIATLIFACAALDIHVGSLALIPAGLAVFAVSFLFIKP